MEKNKPTKEEILQKWESESADRLMDRFDYYERVVYPSMDEWAEIYHKDKLRGDLKAFNSWMCKKQYDGVIPLIDSCIDEYLNPGQ